VIPQDRDGVTMIDARQLHAWLKVSTRFNDWIDRRIAEYGFEAEADFYSWLSKTGGRPRRDVLCTVDMAKELSMVERTERGVTAEAQETGSRISPHSRRGRPVVG